MSIDNSIENKDGDEITIELKSDARTPEQETIRDQKIELMRSYVKKLKPRYETLVEMRYFKEMSYEEISNELNLPLGTVKAQLFRAREFLYNLMKHNIETIWVFNTTKWIISRFNYTSNWKIMSIKRVVPILER